MLCSGRKKSYDERVAQAIDRVFDEDETPTYREAAGKLGMPATTLWRYATEEMEGAPFSL